MLTSATKTFAQPSSNHNINCFIAFLFDFLCIDSNWKMKTITMKWVRQRKSRLRCRVCGNMKWAIDEVAFPIRGFVATKWEILGQTHTRDKTLKRSDQQLADQNKLGKKPQCYLSISVCLSSNCSSDMRNVCIHHRPIDNFIHCILLRPLPLFRR